ncbi:hypothetical protein [uncultured Sulfitobacter sp.]|uniref:hypothetical protein n=1 Tax=uncultured Sulfitobacter sp. TaxID=191468 RepID=UPI002605A38E|nr:hypothetical protein [uncultured Sulfitobacter sp.]
MATETNESEKGTVVIEVPEAVGVFDTFESFQKAFYDLRMVGFSRYDLSVLGSDVALKEKFGKAYLSAEEMEDDPRVPRAAFVSEEGIGEMEGVIVGGAFFIPSYIAMAAMAAAGATAAATAAAVAIVGLPAAAIGVLMARRVQKHHNDYYADQIARGGILLWVRVADKEREKLAVNILKSHSGKDVHVHDWST